MKHLLFGKQKGLNQIITAIDVFGFLLIFTLVVLITSFSEFSNVKQRQALYMTTREYLLKMETKGYLTVADRTDLIYDLGTEGLTEVDLTGTTLSQVPYGSTICLSANQPLTAADFKRDGEYRERYQDAVVKGLAVSRFSDAVCGILRSGDVIDIFALDAATGENICILRDVYVDSAFDSAGVEIPPEDKDQVAIALNVLLTPKQLDILGRYETNEELSFVKTRDVI